MMQLERKDKRKERPEVLVEDVVGH
jgi:hypothetical protein